MEVRIAIINLEISKKGEKQMKNIKMAESLAGVHTHTHTYSFK